MRTGCGCCAAVAAILVLAGCGDAPDVRGGGKVSGDTLTVVSVLPLAGPDAAAARDIVAGQKLALAEARGQTGRFDVNLVAINELSHLPARAAREAISDPQAIAIVGALTTRRARSTTPIVNAAGILDVGTGAVAPALSVDPRYRPARGRTFFTLVPDAEAQARAMLDAAPEGPVAIERDTRADADSEALAAALVRVAGDRLVDRPARARAVLFAGTDVGAAAEFARALRRESPHARVVFGDALARRGLARRLGPAARRARIVAAVPRSVPPDLARRFRARFGRSARPHVVLGHEAMRRVLVAIARAGENGNRRQHVIDAYAAAFSRSLPPQVWRLR